jgi:triphosphatase
MADSTRPQAASSDIEVEWQFDALDLRPVERWLAALPLQPSDDPSLPSLSALAKPSRRLVDRYLDTEDWRIGRAGFVLRTRRRGRSDEATLKDSRPAGVGGLRQRLEVTEALPAGGVAALGPDGPVGRRIAAVAGRRPFHQVLEVRTRRRPFSLRVAGDEVAEVALDDTVITVGSDQQPVRLRRVEVEVVPEWVGALEPLVDDLRSACGLQPAALSKFEAGLLALGVQIPSPPDLGSTEVTTESTLGDLAFAIIRLHLGVLLAREPGTRLGEDIEELHDMRVATRRLRAAIDFFVDVLPVRAQALRSELTWLAGVLGHVRDLDVQIDRMQEMEEWAVAGSATGGSPLEDLRTLLVAQRTSARRDLLDALDSPRWERLASGLTAMVQHSPRRRSPAARLPAAVALPELVMSRHRAVVKAARRAKHSGMAADFHRLRIRCKRLRYSLEFTAGVYGGRTGRFTRKLAKLQDSLGLMQDAEVATTRLLDFATSADPNQPSDSQPSDRLSPRTIFAMGAVAERYRVESEELLAQMPKRLALLTGEEWRDLAAHMARRRLEALATIPPPRPPRRAAAATDAGPLTAAPTEDAPAQPPTGVPAPGETDPAVSTNDAPSGEPPAPEPLTSTATAEETAPPGDALSAWPDTAWEPPEVVSS